MKIESVISAATIFVLPAFARDFRPASQMENIPLPDSSIQ